MKIDAWAEWSQTNFQTKTHGFFEIHKTNTHWTEEALGGDGDMPFVSERKINFRRFYTHTLGSTLEFKLIGLDEEMNPI